MCCGILIAMSIFDKKFDSVRNDWITPDSVFLPLNEEFGFTCDLAAAEDNKKCFSYFGKSDNGLIQEWKGVCWLNPPYGEKGSKLVDWIKKAYNSCQEDASLSVVMLIPARTNTKWFRDYCMKAAEIRFIIGRPKFVGCKHGLPQPLMIVVFKKSAKCAISSFTL